jgi:hypothetical protein
MGTVVISFPPSSKTVTRLPAEPGGASAAISRAITSAVARASSSSRQSHLRDRPIDHRYLDRNNLAACYYLSHLGKTNATTSFPFRFLGASLKSGLCFLGVCVPYPGKIRQPRAGLK